VRTYARIKGMRYNARQIVWRCYKELSALPMTSKHDQPVVNYLRQGVFTLHSTSWKKKGGSRK